MPENFYKNPQLSVRKIVPSNKYGIQFGNPGSEYEFNQENLYGRYKDVTDFQSPLYSQYRKFLQSSTPGIGLNSLLAPLMAGNVDYGTGQKLASQRSQEMAGQRNESINQGVQSFALGMQSQANPILGQMSGNYNNIMNYWENQRQFNAEMEQRKSEESSSLWENIGLTALGVGSMFIPGMQGAGIGMIGGGMNNMLTKGKSTWANPGGYSYDPYGNYKP